MDHQISAPPGLKLSGGIRTIFTLASTHNQVERKKQYHVYVIEVGNSDTIKYYVGSTSQSVEKRFEQHQSRDKDKNAAKIFRKHQGTALILRFDLFEGLPSFTDRETAEIAEGVLAEVVETQMKAGVECDVLRGRKRQRTTAAALKNKSNQ